MTTPFEKFFDEVKAHHNAATVEIAAMDSDEQRFVTWIGRVVDHIAYVLKEKPAIDAQDNDAIFQYLDIVLDDFAAEACALGRLYGRFDTVDALIACAAVGDFERATQPLRQKFPELTQDAISRAITFTSDGELVTERKED